MIKRIAVMTLLMMFIFQITAFAGIANICLVTGWKKIDDSRILLYEGNQAKYVVQTLSPAFIFNVSRIRFTADVVMDGDPIIIDDRQEIIWKITEL